MAKKLTVDEGFMKLSEILEEMEKEDVSLEKSFDLYNKGIELVRSMNETLGEAQERLDVIKNAEADGMENENEF